MQNHQVHLTRSLSSVSSNHNVTFAAAADGKGVGVVDEAALSDAIGGVVASISDQLSRIETQLRQQNADVKSAAATYALQGLKTLMQQDEPLLVSRVERYIELALQQADPEQLPTVYVHSSLRDSIAVRLTAGLESKLKIETEDTLAPGDCRIELNDNGLIASLGHQLQLMEQRLQKSISQGAL